MVTHSLTRIDLPYFLPPLTSRYLNSIPPIPPFPHHPRTELFSLLPTLKLQEQEDLGHSSYITFE